MSQVVDLYDEDGMMEEIDADNLVIDADNDEEEKKGGKGKKERNGVNKQQIKRRTEEEEEQFARDYKKMGGIQHIICSATMTIDNTGRITPKMAKKMKKQGV